MGKVGASNLEGQGKGNSKNWLFYRVRGKGTLADDVLNHDFPPCLFQIAMVSHRADHLDHRPFHLEECRTEGQQ